ncbi:MAG: peptidylprolyl isomerase [Planctomycetaceae bacterium]
MQIAQNTVALIDYTLKGEAGQVIDTTDGGDPLPYLHGAGMIIPGLEAALVGKAVGDALEVTIPPEEAYGTRDASLRQEVEREQFEEIDDLAVGMQFRVDGGNGQNLVITVLEINDDTVVVDGNHALAGVTLNFNVTVREVREATEEEIAHGHPHGFGGCDHDHDS